MKKETTRGLKKTAWKLFSEYIRLRDCLSTAGSREEGKCFTCPRVFPIAQLQAGHFIPGRAGHVLFNEDQVHAQCVACNVFKHGNWPVYLEEMRSLFGFDAVEEMLSARFTIKQWRKPELEQLLIDLKRKIAEL